MGESNVTTQVTAGMPHYLFPVDQCSKKATEQMAVSPSTDTFTGTTMEAQWKRFTQTGSAAGLDKHKLVTARTKIYVEEREAILKKYGLTLADITDRDSEGHEVPAVGKAEPKLGKQKFLALRSELGDSRSRFLQDMALITVGTEKPKATAGAPKK